LATIVAFHAHPDDEVLLTGGTLARLAAEGHRVVIVTACSVALGGVGARGSERLDHLRAGAAVLGAARVVHLGYADSGHGPVLYPDPPDAVRFVRADPGEAAGRLADVLREEKADLLLSYEVGARAADLTGVRVLEATAPREVVTLLFGAMRLLRLVVRYDAAEVNNSFTPRASITHRISVRPYVRQKRDALAAHTTYTSSSGRSARLARLAIALPVPVLGLILGREWFAEPGVTVTVVSRDVLE
jgi:LmbE family N-acetylglucosaminyl deacetylase